MTGSLRGICVHDNLRAQNRGKFTHRKSRLHEEISGVASARQDFAKNASEHLNAERWLGKAGFRVGDQRFDSIKPRREWLATPVRECGLAPFAASRPDGFVASVLTQAALNLDASLEALAIDAMQADDAGRLVRQRVLGVLDAESISTQPLVALCDMIRTDFRHHG